MWVICEVFFDLQFEFYFTQSNFLRLETLKSRASEKERNSVFSSKKLRSLQMEGRTWLSQLEVRRTTNAHHSPDPSTPVQKSVWLHDIGSDDMSPLMWNVTRCSWCVGSSHSGALVTSIVASLTGSHEFESNYRIIINYENLVLFWVYLLRKNLNMRKGSLEAGIWPNLIE